MAEVKQEKKTAEDYALDTPGKLCVRHLPKKITFKDEDLKKLFAPFGKIVSLNIPRKKDIPKGFGFVQFAEPADAEKALEALKGKDLGGESPIDVTHARIGYIRSNQLASQTPEGKAARAEAEKKREERGAYGTPRGRGRGAVDRGRGGRGAPRGFERGGMGMRGGRGMDRGGMSMRGSRGMDRGRGMVRGRGMERGGLGMRRGNGMHRGGMRGGMNMAQGMGYPGGGGYQEEEVYEYGYEEAEGYGVDEFGYDQEYTDYSEGYEEPVYSTGVSRGRGGLMRGRQQRGAGQRGRGAGLGMVHSVNEYGDGFGEEYYEEGGEEYAQPEEEYYEEVEYYAGTNIPKGKSGGGMGMRGRGSTGVRGGPGMGARGGPGMGARGGPGMGARGGPGMRARGGPGMGARGGPAMRARGGPAMRARGDPAIRARGGPSIGSRGGLARGAAANGTGVTPGMRPRGAAANGNRGGLGMRGQRGVGRGASAQRGRGGMAPSNTQYEQYGYEESYVEDNAYGTTEADPYTEEAYAQDGGDFYQESKMPAPAARGRFASMGRGGGAGRPKPTPLMKEDYGRPAPLIKQEYDYVGEGESDQMYKQEVIRPISSRGVAPASRSRVGYQQGGPAYKEEVAESYQSYTTTSSTRYPYAETRVMSSLDSEYQAEGDDQYRQPVSRQRYEEDSYSQAPLIKREPLDLDSYSQAPQTRTADPYSEPQRGFSRGSLLDAPQRSASGYVDRSYKEPENMSMMRRQPARPREEMRHLGTDSSRDMMASRRREYDDSRGPGAGGPRRSLDGVPAKRERRDFDFERPRMR